jgi:RND family efflux transporter MFP subunit
MTDHPGIDPSPPPSPAGAAPPASVATAAAVPSQPRRHPWRGWVAAVVIVLILAAVACKVMAAKASPAADNQAQAALAAAIPVAVVQVGRGDVVRDEVFEGEFLPYQQVELHPEVAGFLTAISVDEGDRVKDQQVLATLEVPGLEEDIARARAQAEHDEHVIATTKATADQNHQTYLRLFGVSQQQAQLIAQQDIDAAKALDLSSMAAWQAATSQEAVSQAELAKLLTFRRYCTITAPFAGVVTRRFADPGTLVQGGVSAGAQVVPLIQLSQQDLLRLSFPVTESLVALVHVGSPAVFHVGALNEDRTTSVTRFRTRVENSTRTMEVQIDVPNADLHITPGMYASVHMQVDRHVGVLILPQEAIRRRPQAHLVYVVGADHVVLERPVTIGLESPKSIEILSGVKLGETVVYGNLEKIRSGQLVDPKPLADKPDKPPATSP